MWNTLHRMVVKTPTKKSRFVVVLGCCVSIYVLGNITLTPIFFQPVEESPSEQSAEQESLKGYVSYLSARYEDRTHAVLTRSDATVGYLTGVFGRFCDTTRLEPFVVDGNTFYNVVCLFQGEKDDIVVVGAHYDVYGAFPGADDNASGVAGLLELSRMFSESQTPLYTLELVAYALEEPPYFATSDMGSFQHIKSSIDRGETIVMAVSLEMIGYFSDTSWSQNYPVGLLHLLYPTKGNFITLVSDYNSRTAMASFKRSMVARDTIPLRSLSAPSFIEGVDYSDHRSYWKFGVPAFMITDTSFFRNPYYHTDKDTWETLDYVRMAGVVDAVYYALSDMK